MSEWKPTQELRDWMKMHYEGMNPNGVWMPEGTGLTYQKEENGYRLVKMMDSDESRDNHDRLKVLMWDIGIQIEDTDYELIPLPESLEELQTLEVEMKRNLALSWADKDGTLLTDMNLENVWPEYIEDKEILLDDGETTTVEMWGFNALNPNTDEYVTIDPHDYHLLMGDEFFLRFRTEEYEYRAMTREEMVTSIDSIMAASDCLWRNDIPRGCGVGSKYTAIEQGEVRIPPWLWGSYCEFQTHKAETTLDDFGGEEE